MPVKTLVLLAAKTLVLLAALYAVSHPLAYAFDIARWHTMSIGCWGAALLIFADLGVDTAVAGVTWLWHRIR